MQLSSIAPSNSIRSLFNNNLMSNVWGRGPFCLYCSLLQKKNNPNTHAHNPIGGCAIGFLPCRINWNHIFGWELSICLTQGSEEDTNEGKSPERRRKEDDKERERMDERHGNGLELR